MVGLATPVFDSSQRVVGVIEGTLAASTVGSIIGGTTLPDGQLVIVDHQGHLLSGTNATVARSFRTAPFVSKALSGQTGVGSGTVPGMSGTRLVGYAPVASTRWAVIAESPASTLNQPVAALEERLVAIALLVLVLAAGTAALLAVLLRRLGREQERAGALLACVGDGVATVDLSGRVVRVNPALEQLSGKTEQRLPARDTPTPSPSTISRAIPSLPTIPWSPRPFATVSSKTSSGYSLHLGASDGRRIPIGVTASPLVVSGELEGAVVVIRDVSHETGDRPAEVLSRLDGFPRAPHSPHDDPGVLRAAARTGRSRLGPEARSPQSDPCLLRTPGAPHRRSSFRLTHRIRQTHPRSGRR